MMTQSRSWNSNISWHFTSWSLSKKASKAAKLTIACRSSLSLTFEMWSSYVALSSPRLLLTLKALPKHSFSTLPMI